MNLIGRNREIQLLDSYYYSGKPEFIALYGRRRVGKTFLIDQKYGDELCLKITGIIDGSAQEQMAAFAISLRQLGYQGDIPKNWLDAFAHLQTLLSQKIVAKKRCVLFIDELPCFETPKSGFVKAFGNFWNNWCSTRPEIMLIVCGSATSWMIKNIIDSHGGLHNRITHEMHIRPFTLAETENFLRSNNILWDRLSVLQSYMVFGGIPYYLNLIEKGESLAQSIDRLFFAEDGTLKNEYARLMKSLFKTPDPYIAIVETLCKKKKGLTREEIANAMRIPNNGHLSECLTNLVQCDFIRYYNVREKKIKLTGGVYQLTDFFVYFVNQFCKKATTDKHYWTNHLNTPTVNNWMWLAFERICLAHVEQIKKALGVEQIGTEYYSWRSKNAEEGAQIDFVLERADRIVNVFEIKYSEGEYSLQKDEYLKIQNRIAAFKQETGLRSALFPTMMTTFGLKQNEYAAQIQKALCMDDLFAD
ncbi:MAG: AAA family ATPase [Candidatus Saccharibacteria bacterium]|nr:AAA family ATPase [Candidatus Saccharibacteria bacterium]